MIKSNVPWWSWQITEVQEIFRNILRIISGDQNKRGNPQKRGVWKAFLAMPIVYIVEVHWNKNNHSIWDMVFSEEQARTTARLQQHDYLQWIHQDEFMVNFQSNAVTHIFISFPGTSQSQSEKEFFFVWRKWNGSKPQHYNIHFNQGIWLTVKLI